MNEMLSRLHDGDTEGLDAARVVAASASDAEARDRWTRYQLVGDVVRGNPTPDDGFTLRILARLEGVERDPGYDPLVA